MNERKDMNFELNLLPVISVLAVCISFLLLTAVWINIGTLDISQSVGSESEQKPVPAFWILFNSPHDVTIEFKDEKGATRNRFTFKNINNKVDFSSLTHSLKVLKKQNQNVGTAFIAPRSHTAYEDVVQIIDYLKKENINDVGISPI